MAKSPEARYRNCEEFIGALEGACLATKGWKPLPRGGSLKSPPGGSLIGLSSPAVTLPPPRRTRHGETTAAAETEKKRSGFVPFLIVILLAAGLLVVVARFIPPRTVTPPSTRTNGAQAAQSETGPPLPEAPTPEALPPTAEPPVIAEAKPSPIGPADGATADLHATPADAQDAVATQPETEPPPSLPKKIELPNRPATRATGAPQEVLVTSSPGRATATLDGNSDSCTTPCSFSAAPGPHTLAITMRGYEVEHRYINVGTSPLELPPVVLRAPGGTLMLTSVPPGATVLVNGRRIDQVTPARIPLATGKYTITLDKDGQQFSETVEIGNGINYRKVLLGQ